MMAETEEAQHPEKKTETVPSGRRVIALLVAGALVVGGYFALGMPGMDHGSDSVEHDVDAHP